MDHFAGLDVSVKETSVCIVDDTGRIVREVKVASEPEALLQADLAGARERPLECLLQDRLAGDLAADVADDAAEPRAQEAQLPTVAVELLGVGVAPRHHRRPLGDA